jgi:isopenicillin N synthase-like dioxygenase
MAEMETPVIDISSFMGGSVRDKERVADQVRRAIEGPAIFAVTGHGVADALMSQARDLAVRFFDLPLAEKGRVLSTDGAGYTPIPEQNLAHGLGTDSPVDLKETFNVLKDPARNRWPERLVGMEPTLSEYLQQCEGLAVTLIHLFAFALGRPESFFDDRLEGSVSLLRMINYPSQTDDLRPGEYRCQPHTDLGTISILQFDNQPGGLQVCDADGGWKSVHPVPGAFIINIGDEMERWTDGQWKATLHRVVNPPAGARLTSRRQSLIVFHNPASVWETVESYLRSVSARPTTLSGHGT